MRACYVPGMLLTLIPHPDTPCDAVTDIDVDVGRTHDGDLRLRYIAAGDIGGLLLPPKTSPGRHDELWKHTCFETFVRAPGADAYLELNVSPSTQWAAYRFASYRAGMAAALDIAPPRIETRVTATTFELIATLAPAGLADLAPEIPWRLGLCAVIEETSGRKSYWALAHPAGRPDFHHADGFAAELPAA